MNAISKYEQLCNTPSDINEHLSTLKIYANECDTVVEMGVRWVVSTFAFIAAKPKKLISLDLYHPREHKPDWVGEMGARALEEAFTYAKEQNIDFSFVKGNSLEYDCPECDLLFIDRWHAFRQLKAELNLHHSKVKKYIALHDTTLFESQDETVWGPSGEGREVGLWNAVTDFLSYHPEWVIHERYTNNNGLTILKRVK